jgi:starvation-inducible outer membrane lipoprotein
MKTIAIICAALALTACAGIPADPSKMTPEQLRESAKDRSAMASCTTANSPWGVGRTIYVQIDRQTLPTGSVTVAADCAVTFNSETAPRAARAGSQP